MGHRLTVCAVLVAVAAGTGGAAGQEPRATVQTYRGASYTVGDLSLEVFYTIGEPREKAEGERFQSTLSVVAPMGAPGEARGQAPAATEAERAEKLLRGHARATAITVSRDGVETQIAWDRIRAMLFSRQSVAVPLLPPYIPHYRYAVSVTLVDGQRVEADYVSLGTSILQGTTPEGRVQIPWEEVQHVIFER